MICTTCTTDKPLSSFPPIKLDRGSVYQVKECNSCGNNRRRERLQKIRNEVFKHYGNKCICCGESTRQFLALDHVNGGGNYNLKHNNHNSYSKYTDAKKRNFPSCYRILCHNCNIGRELNGGICPHKNLKTEV